MKFQSISVGKKLWFEPSDARVSGPAREVVVEKVGRKYVKISGMRGRDKNVRMEISSGVVMVNDYCLGVCNEIASL